MDKELLRQMAEVFANAKTEESQQKIIDDYFHLIELSMQNAEYKGWRECFEWHRKREKEAIEKALAR